MKVLMCQPNYFEVVYKINPWMDKSIHVHKPIAMSQWEYLKTTIEDCGAEVHLIDQVSGLPDMVFTANAALILPQGVFLSHFSHSERQPESEHFKAWFINAGYTVFGDDPAYYRGEGDARHYNGPYFEGAGDALFVGDTLFAGFHIRSEKDAYKQIQQLGVNNIVFCKLENENYYHIDTCFCPLDEQYAIWYPSAFSINSQQRMQQTGKALLAIPDNEAKSFACNAVVLGKHVILPDGCVGTRKLLEKLDFNVHFCPMSEFLKSGGACKCLTLRLC